MRSSLRCLPSVLAVASMCFAAEGYCHSASDAYLTLTEVPSVVASSAGPMTLRGQWDIALRDLDFVLKLDDNGDGNIVWGELRNHQRGIAQYALPQLSFSADGAQCQILPGLQQVDDHADGAYASLMFEVKCPSASKLLTLQYQLFFAVDPSHRAILVFRRGEDVATSVLSAEQPRVQLPLQ